MRQHDDDRTRQAQEGRARLSLLPAASGQQYARTAEAHRGNYNGTEIGKRLQGKSRVRADDAQVNLDCTMHTRRKTLNSLARNAPHSSSRAALPHERYLPVQASGLVSGVSLIEDPATRSRKNCNILHMTKRMWLKLSLRVLSSRISSGRSLCGSLSKAACP